jgi:hypothetical protein
MSPVFSTKKVCNYVYCKDCRKKFWCSNIIRVFEMDVHCSLIIICTSTRLSTVFLESLFLNNYTVSVRVRFRIRQWKNWPRVGFPTEFVLNSLREMKTKGISLFCEINWPFCGITCYTEDSLSQKLTEWNEMKTKLQGSGHFDETSKKTSKMWTWKLTWGATRVVNVITTPRNYA